MSRLLLASTALLLAACARKDSAARSDTGAVTDSARAVSTTSSPAGTPSSPAATAEVKDSAGRSLGTLNLSASLGGIVAEGHLMGLPPGAHGIHLHSVGQCQPPFASAGPHWNPTQKQHGTDNPKGPHLGDMPNVAAGSDSSGHARVTSAGGTLDSLLDADGASVVVHATADDYKTDPSGNSGARIACGVVARK